MGFGGFKDVAEAKYEAIQKERERVDALPSVRSIEFKKFSDAQIKTAEGVKKSFLGGGDKKKIIESMENKSAEYAEVKCVADIAIYTEGHEVYYAHIVDGSGTEYMEAVFVMGTKFFNASASSSPKKCYLVHFYIGKKERFVIVKPDDFKAMRFIVESFYRPSLIHSVTEKTILE